MLNFLKFMNDIVFVDIKLDEMANVQAMQHLIRNNALRKARIKLPRVAFHQISEMLSGDTSGRVPMLLLLLQLRRSA
ncbi:hypothetical protein WI61_24925 [Burkholderia cepacia]|nr:hypothetical protein WI48_17200 [Burkholderia cepacia]KVA62477.1 hypothetical protein WI47_03690 [Burkholderia cepacia]KVA70918.1 hypothetical protein WI49_05470 [Burkholderia cepacia]KVA89422.1 hypothetical protein WI50_11405 [Burkholderia cepacia]KVA95167.1 hypothetical protein WI51_38765 [Burkholderia cepacia]